jgi:serine phosphatase RsbU (regulator of sigma subunit)
MLKNLTIGPKILVMLLSVSIVAVGVNGYFAFTTAKHSLEEESFNKLTAVREMKADQIEDYFKHISNEVLTFSEDRMIIDAMRAFKIGFQAIDSELGYTDSKMTEIESAVKSYYQAEFLERLKANLDTSRWGALSSTRFLPKERNAKILQYLYIASNSYETGSKDILEYASDGSQYSSTHKIYHPIIRNFLKKFGYYDIFLVDHETGHIVYTVFKEVDFGTSLISGYYREANIAVAFRGAREANSKDFVRLVDFSSYEPSYNAPASFIASPIYDGKEKVGVLLFQMPIDNINDIMTSKRKWSEVGLGKSGETYIVGEDFKLRNQSRFLIEDRENYFKMIKKMGLPSEVITRIRNLKSSIGLQPVKTQGTEAALRGETGNQMFPDYRGVPVLSSYKPLDIPDVNWVIMSEIDEAEAFTYVFSLRNIIILLFVGLVIGIVIVAFLFSRTITRSLKELTSYSRTLSKHDFSEPVSLYFPLELEEISQQHDEIGELVRSFHRMQIELENSIENLKKTTSTKERMKSELNIGREIQMSMLPLLFPAFPDHSEFSVYAALQPALEVSGDFYDFYFVDEDHFCFCIGDVSGKGVPSALFMAVTKTLIKSRAAEGLSPASILTHVNEEISRDNKADMFITIFAGILNIKTGEMVYTNAGHNPPYIKRNNGSLERLDQRHGWVVGFQGGVAYKEDKAILSPGDILMIYTDGVTEAMDRAGNFFTDARLEKLLVSRDYESTEDLVQTTLSDVEQFQSKAEQFDDITVLSIQFFGAVGSNKNPVHCHTFA